VSARPVALSVLAAVATVVAHVIVTGAAPGAMATLTGLVLATVVAAGLDARHARSLTVALAAQLVVHVVLAATQPVGCLQAVGRAAWAGLDLARWGASAACDPGQLLLAGSPQQVALLAVVGAVPLLAGHALAAALGAAGVDRIQASADSALTLLGAVLVVLPGPVRLPATRRLLPARESRRVPQTSLVPVRPLVRRGPPVAVTA
jgi:hypothetical protein